jgi:hypothetical protein
VRHQRTKADQVCVPFFSTLPVRHSISRFVSIAV